MDWPIVLVKLTGLVLLAVTLRSIYRHVRERRKARAQGQQDQQSTGERALNSILLYAWYAFMLAFSTGMIVNN